MNIRNEITRLFYMWIKELEGEENFLQVAIVTALLQAFLAWYDGDE